MNLLIDDLPTAVDISGQEISIDTDFRTALRIVLAYEDDELTMLEKQAVLLENLYPEQPVDLTAAIAQGVKFLNGGDDLKDDEEIPVRLYSFSKDASLIFAAFRQTHGIDLENAQLHWWKFLALFGDLGSDTVFCSLVGLRKRVKSGKASKEESQIAKEMGEAFDIPDFDDRSIEEKEREAEFLRLVRQKRNK